MFRFKRNLIYCIIYPMYSTDLKKRAPHVACLNLTVTKVAHGAKKLATTGLGFCFLLDDTIPLTFYNKMQHLLLYYMVRSRKAKCLFTIPKSNVHNLLSRNCLLVQRSDVSRFHRLF